MIETPTTPPTVEPGKDTSEGRLVLAVVLFSIVGLVFAGLLALADKMSVTQFIDLFQTQLAVISGLAGVFTGFRTIRKNSAEKAKAGGAS